MRRKLKRAGIAMLSVTCIIGMNIQGTLAMGNGAPENRVQPTVIEDPVLEPNTMLPLEEDTSVPDAGEGENPDTGEGENPDTGEGENPDTGEGENPDTGEGENPDTGEGENPDAGEGENPDAGEGENPDAGEGENPDTGEGENPDTGEGENPDAGEGENPDAGETPDKPSKPTEPTQPSQPAKPAQPAQPSTPSNEGEVVIPGGKPSPDRVIHDSNPDAVYKQNTSDPSQAFLDKRDKIKYNVALPIEGIPVFITQEMIIGALKCQDETGYPASVTIAQIIQESGFGVYGPQGEKGLGLSYLAFQYNNLFGIKGKGPAGSVDMRTGEQTSSGEGYMITAGFRVYNTYTESIEDRTKLLKEVYSDLTEGVKDANTFAMRIGGRWATDIHYSQSLIKQMETYDLYRLDKLTLTEFSDMIGTFANPCPGSTVTSTFGWREFTNSFHKGIDLGTGAFNIPTYAVDDGEVITVGWNDSAGNWIIIDHGNGIVTKYMHHDKMYVKEGQKVTKGQQIGLSGTTGNSTGNHLHFQVEENGAAVNPAPYLGLKP